MRREERLAEIDLLEDPLDHVAGEHVSLKAGRHKGVVSPAVATQEIHQRAGSGFQEVDQFRQVATTNRLFPSGRVIGR